MRRKNFDGTADMTPVADTHPEIVFDFSKTTGAIKPLHGINNSPVTYGDPLPELKDAGIPYTRLHDSAGTFGGSCFVDIPNIFPEFDADPDDPASYDFAFTDAYLKGLTASGIKIFYRLGVTIEGMWQIQARRIHPPADFDKWARICAGIIRHYNEGWADGFHYDIKYWEVWNEPDNPSMWTGTKEQYFELYRVTANYLKKMFPEIKIGGYGSCGFYALTRAEVVEWHKSFIPYFEDFLKFVTTPATAAPLDFFSWHLYSTDPHEIIMHSDYVCGKLEECGLTETENIFNEWNYLDRSSPDCWDLMKEMPGATFTAAAFCLMQNSGIDKAMYYDALPTRRYGGLYYFPSGRVTKTYYSFKAFNELFKLGEAVECHCVGVDKVCLLAAKDDKGKGAALVVNRNMETLDVRLTAIDMDMLSSCVLLDNYHLLTETNYLFANGILNLPAQSVMLLKFG